MRIRITVDIDNSIPDFEKQTEVASNFLLEAQGAILKDKYHRVSAIGATMLQYFPAGASASSYIDLKDEEVRGQQS